VIVRDPARDLEIDRLVWSFVRSDSIRIERGEIARAKGVENEVDNWEFHSPPERNSSPALERVSCFPFVFPLANFAVLRSRRVSGLHGSS